MSLSMRERERSSVHTAWTCASSKSDETVSNGMVESTRICTDGIKNVEPEKKSFGQNQIEKKRERKRDRDREYKYSNTLFQKHQSLSHLLWCLKTNM